MSAEQIVSRQRVAAHGEVYTAEREVKAMCDLVKYETDRVDSRFLEPACGTGNFLVEILTRKLAKVDEMTKEDGQRDSYSWERYALLALGSLYGIDILPDNVRACRERLFEIWDAAYRACCRKDVDAGTASSARFILSRNIVCGNAQTMLCVDEEGRETDRPIVFSEWSFPRGDSPRMKRCDFEFREIVSSHTREPTLLNPGYVNDLGKTVFGQRKIGEEMRHYRRLDGAARAASAPTLHQEVLFS